MKKTILFSLLFILIMLKSKSQDLLSSKQGSYFSYVYKIDDKLAKTLYRSTKIKPQQIWFSNLVDSIPVYGEQKKKLNIGHYIIASLNENTIEYKLLSINNIKAIIINNNRDLIIQITDTIGQIISEAEVKINSKKIDYEPKSECYKLVRSNKNGFLEIIWNNHSNFMNIERTKNNPLIRQITDKVLYQSPLAIAWLPLESILLVPVNGIKRIMGLQIEKPSLLHYIFRPFTDIIASIYHYEPEGWLIPVASIFSYNYRFRQHQYHGYLATNKPIYKPGDTLKFKAFVLDYKKRAILEPLNLELKDNEKTFLNFKISPNKKGAYCGEIVLNDSLNLILDNKYDLKLNNSHNYLTVENSFQYEDYLLNNINYAVDPEANEQMRGKPFYINISGKDANGMPVLDGKAEIEIIAGHNSEFGIIEKPKENFTFVPSKLYQKQIYIDPSAKTRFLIPDSIFPNANLRYTLKVICSNENNEKQEFIFYNQYFVEKTEIRAELVNDSIQFKAYKLGNPFEIETRFTAKSGNHQRINKIVNLPFTMKINEFDTEFKFVSSFEKWTLNPGDIQVNLECEAWRTKDSIFLECKNPNKLSLHYFLFRKNKEIRSETGINISFKEKATSLANYEILIKYIWNGEEQTVKKTLEFKDKQLNIKLLQANQILPGQATSIDIEVKDAFGNPAPDIDLTAFAQNAKFKDSNLPEIEALSKSYPDREELNSFKLNDLELFEKSKLLKSINGSIFNGLDTMAFYQFLFPKNGYFKTEVDGKDQTQFAIFVTNNGEIKAIRSIFIDDQAVYINACSSEQAYSFKVNPGFHSIKLYCDKNEIKIDSLEFIEDKKTIVSLSLPVNNKHIHVKELKPKLIEQQTDYLNNFVFSVSNETQSGLLKQNEKVFYLSFYRIFKSENQSVLFGPIERDTIQFISTLNKFSVNCLFKPFYNYTIQQNLVDREMIENKQFINSKKTLEVKSSIFDNALETWQVQRQWELSKQFVFPFYEDTTSKIKGSCNLTIKINEDEKELLSMILIPFDSNNTIKISESSTLFFENLNKGRYEVVYLFKGNLFALSPPFELLENGSNTLYFSNKTNKDSLFREKINKTINKIKKLNDNEYQALQKLKNYSEASDNHHLFSENGICFLGTTKIIYGQVISEKDGEPIDKVKLIGERGNSVLTDKNGRFKINVSLGEKIQLNKFKWENKVFKVDNCNSYLLKMIKGDDIILFERAVELDEENYLDRTSLSGFFKHNKSAIPPPPPAPMLTRMLISEASTFNFTKSNEKISKNKINGIKLDSIFFNTAQNAKGLRTNFSDYAFWKPYLFTDKNGKASFNVNYPDDITAWNTTILAMGEKGFSGILNKQNKSFKPISAELAMPLFLIKGDTCEIIGKTLNYLSDTFQIARTFRVNEVQKLERKGAITHLLIDKLNISALNNDTISVQFSIERIDGYKDGEKRLIPTKQQGVEEKNGFYVYAEKDTVIHLKFDKKDTKTYLHIETEFLKVAEIECNNIIKCPYDGNEQMASKLKALLINKKISDQLKIKFKQTKLINEYVQKLKSSQNSDGGWAWWPGDKSEIWTSAHVCRALLSAKQENIKVDEHLEQAKLYLLTQVNGALQYDTWAEVVHTLKEMKTQVNFSSNLEKIKNAKKVSLYSNLQRISLMQDLGLNCKIDTILKWKKETILGGLYWTEKSSQLFNNDIELSILVYKIFSKDSVYSKYLPKIRQYLNNQLNLNGWGNTYTSIRCLEILVDNWRLLKEKSKTNTIEIQGDIDFKMKESRIDTSFESKNEIILNIKGQIPTFIASWQSKWNEKPKSIDKEFKITSKIIQKDKEAKFVKLGDKMTLQVNVNVKKNADFILIEVPIPAGCTYANKNQFINDKEIHKAFFKEKCNLYIRNLKAGVHQFEIDLIPRYAGSYTLNPVKIELLYYPIFMGRNEMKFIKLTQ